MKKFSVLALLVAGYSGLAIANAPQTVQGIVSRFLLAPRGEVDGLLLKDGTTVKVAPHLGRELVKLVKANDQVVITTAQAPVSLEKYGRGARATEIQNKASGKKLVDAPAGSTPPSIPPTGKPSTETFAKGKIGQYLVNDQGEMDGLILSEGTEVKFPPHVGKALLPLLAANKTGDLSASGPGTKTEYGSVLEAKSMTYGGKQVPGLDAPPRPQ